MSNNIVLCQTIILPEFNVTEIVLASHRVANHRRYMSCRTVRQYLSPAR